MINEFTVVIIASVLGFLTGGIPAYLTYRATNNRLDAEAEERTSHVDVNITEATQKVIDAALDSIDLFRATMNEKVANVEKKAELALQEATMVKDDLEEAREEILNLTRLVCELYTGSLKLILQLKEQGITPDFKLPTVGKEIQELIDKNGWH